MSILPQYLRPEGLRLKKRLRSTSYLDALRGYAAWIVINFHINADPQVWIVRQPFFNVFYAGRAMVDIFFIISGYVLSHKMLRLMREREGDKLLQCLASSMFRRYLRLYCSAAVASLIAMVMVYLCMRPSGIEPRNSLSAQIWDWILDMGHFTNPFTYIPGWWHPDVTNSRYLDVLWTIPVEFRGSMILFIFCAACCKLSSKSRIRACWLLILLSYCWQVAYVALFLFGAFLAERSQDRAAAPIRIATPASSFSPPDVEEQHERQQILLQEDERTLSATMQTTSVRSYVLNSTLLAIGLFLCGQPNNVSITIDHGPEPWRFLSKFIPQFWDGGDLALEHFWLSIGACLIVYSLEACPLFQRPFNTGFSQYLGQLSFGIYVMHVPIRNSLYHALDAWDMNHLRNSAFGFLLIYVLYIMLVLWVADYFTRIDCKVIAFGRWVEEKCFCW